MNKIEYFRKRKKNLSSFEPDLTFGMPNACGMPMPNAGMRNEIAELPARNWVVSLGKERSKNEKYKKFGKNQKSYFNIFFLFLSFFIVALKEKKLHTLPFIPRMIFPVIAKVLFLFCLCLLMGGRGVQAQVVNCGNYYNGAWHGVQNSANNMYSNDGFAVPAMAPSLYRVLVCLRQQPSCKSTLFLTRLLFLCKFQSKLLSLSLHTYHYKYGNHFSFYSFSFYLSSPLLIKYFISIFVNIYLSTLYWL